MQDAIALFEQIRPEVVRLSPEGRLQLIRAIAVIEPSVPVSTIADQNKRMLTEQEAWFEHPLSEREKYRGMFIALRHGEVIDHDPDQITLLKRIRQDFGQAPIPIISGDWETTPEYTFVSTQQNPQNGA